MRTVFTVRIFFALESMGAPQTTAIPLVNYTASESGAVWAVKHAMATVGQRYRRYRLFGKGLRRSFMRVTHAPAEGV
jgi:hypothetical protein